MKGASENAAVCAALAKQKVGFVLAHRPGYGHLINHTLRPPPLPPPPPFAMSTRPFPARRVVVMIIGKLSESMPGDTKRLVLFPLLRPLLLFWGPEGRKPQTPLPPGSQSAAAAAAAAATEANSAPPTKGTQILKPNAAPPSPAVSAAAEVAAAATVGGEAQGQAGAGGGGDGGGGVGERNILSDEEKLERCLEDLEKLLTAAPAPAPLLALLSGMGVAEPLFRLHCFCAT